MELVLGAAVNFFLYIHSNKGHSGVMSRGGRLVYSVMYMVTSKQRLISGMWKS